jgi:HK97 family phage portal protein
MRLPFLPRKEQREYKLNAALSVLANAGFTIQSKAGVPVREETALRYTAVLACVRVLFEDVAGLPLITYQRLQPRGKERAPDYPLYELLHNQPNPELDSFQWRACLQMHAGLWGSCYAEIEMANGWPVALWPIPPRRITIRRDSGSGQLFYRVEPATGGSVDLAYRQVFRVPWVLMDGVTALSPIGLMREAIGLGLATEEFGERFFSNDARPGIVLMHPNPKGMSEEAHKRVVDTFEQRHQGLSRAQRVSLLEEGMTIKEVGIPPEDAQFLETRTFQVTEIARGYRMPPHKIGELSHATFTNIEHQGIEYVTDTLRPWLVRWEQAILTQLIPPADRKAFFTEFLVDGLLRGDTVSRYQAYGTAWGKWLCTNDILELENRNPVEGGDIYYVPLNMQPAGTPPEPTPPPPVRTQRENRSITTRRRIAGAYRPLIAAAGTRIVNRERREVLAAAEKHLGRSDHASFDAWLNKFYGGHVPYVTRQMAPVLSSYAEQISADAAEQVGGDVPDLAPFMAAYTASFADRWIGSSRGQLLSVAGDAIRAGEDPLAALTTRLDEWQAKRPDKTADWETVRAGNAVAKETYQEAGIERLVWVAGANCCPYCEEMDGKTTEITKTFLSAGDSLDAGGDSMPVTTELGHPPLHDGCCCDVAPG